MEETIKKIREATAKDSLEFRLHARKRMAQRNISYNDIHQIILNGKVISVVRLETCIPEKG